MVWQKIDQCYSKVDCYFWLLNWFYRLAQSRDGHMPVGVMCMH